MTVYMEPGKSHDLDIAPGEYTVETWANGVLGRTGIALFREYKRYSAQWSILADETKPLRLGEYDQPGGM